MNLAREYDLWHQKVFEAEPRDRDASSPWYKIVLDQMAPVAGQRVLEVACGRGGFAALMASKGAAMFGADFSGAALDIARGRSTERGKESLPAAFAQADAQQLPYPDETFDVVVSCETIEHLPDPFEGIKEMARVCRSGGLLYLTTPNYFNLMGL